MKNKPKYCWDTNVFLSHFKGEAESKEPQMLGVIDEIHSGRAILVVPVIVYTEMLSAKNSEKIMGQFSEFLLRPNVQVATITLAIAKKAESIRSKGLKEKPNERVLQTPDAIFIACAITYGVDMFHSFDKAMLQLNSHPTAECLKICSPKTKSGAMPLPRA